MKMMFIGATHEVTGSCTYLEACGKKFLVDFGMQQGEDMFENVQIPVAPGDIDFVLLTHAHIDHSGLLPLLFAGGFSGEIHSTDATANLCSVMLRDSAHIQEFEAEWRSRKAKRRGEADYEPLYTMDDALGAIELFISHKYEEEFEVSPGISVMFRDAGHLLGCPRLCEHYSENDGKRRNEDDRILRRHRKHRPAAYPGSAVYRLCGLRGHGVYLRKPRSRQTDGLCYRSCRRYPKDI